MILTHRALGKPAVKGSSVCPRQKGPRGKMQRPNFGVASPFVAVGITLALVIAAHSQEKQNDRFYHPSRHVRNIPEVAEDAREKGLKKIVVAPTLVDWNELPGVDEIFSNNATALVEVRRIESYYEAPYKAFISSSVTLRIVRYLAGSTHISSNTAPEVHKCEVPQSAPSEIVVTIQGGDIFDNGIEVEQPSRYPQLQVGQHFIAIVGVRCSDGKLIYALPYGPDSLIAIDRNGHLQRSPWLRAGGLRGFLDQYQIKFMTELRTRIIQNWGAR